DKSRKKRAPSAHVSLVCAQTAFKMGSGSRRKFIRRRRTNKHAANKRATLLRNVNLFLFVNVTEEVNEPTNKGNGCQPERDPSGSVTAGGVRVGHKSIEIVNRTNGGNYANQYRKNILQAFHFEPPPAI